MIGQQNKTEELGLGRRGKIKKDRQIDRYGWAILARDR